MKKDILNAIVFLREKNNTIPSDVLDFMRDASVQREKAIEVATQEKLTSEQVSECIEVLKKNGVNTEAMSYGTLVEISKSMVELTALGDVK